jgi:hypothetical protein
MRFIPVAFREDARPAFWVSTSRICRGIHDWRCTQSQSQTFGPLVLEGSQQHGVPPLFACDRCGRVQPPNVAAGEEDVCLYCSDSSAIQHTGDSRVTQAGVAAVAALYAASATLRVAKQADPDGYIVLLDETGEALRSLFDDSAWAVKQEPARGQQTLYRGLAMVARQILANAKDYAALNVEAKEPLPVTEIEGE